MKTLRFERLEEAHIAAILDIESGGVVAVGQGGGLRNLGAA